MKKTKAVRPVREIAILALLAFAALISYLLIYRDREGGTAVITVGQRIVAEVPLSRNGTYPVVDEDGHYLLTCIVSSGEIRVSESTCRDHICINQGSIHLTRETIVCLPNQVVVTIHSAGTDDLDGVVK